jgi:hypothetical protein
MILYGGRRRLLDISHIFYVRTVLALGVLSAPAAYLLLRHTAPWLAYWNGWAFALVLLFFLVAPFGILGSAASVEDASRVVFTHILEVMWWPKERIDLQPMRSGLETQRAPFYVKREALKTFQTTWVGKAREARLAVELLREVNGRVCRRILDIGGGDGSFTRMLLEGLKSKGLLDTKPEVVMVDPVDWGEKYRAQLGNFNGTFTFLCGPFGEVERSIECSAFDLVIVSHSLYGICDAPLVSREVNVSDALRRISELRCEGGALLLILASARSRAYEFKRAALLRLFGCESRDLTAEDVRFVEALKRAKLRIVDGVLNVSALLDGWERGEPDELLDWLSYFLRAPLRHGEEASDEIAELLNSFVCAWESLSEDLLENPKERDSGADRVLPHKTYVWVS